MTRSTLWPGLGPAAARLLADAPIFRNPRDALYTHHTTFRIAWKADCHDGQDPFKAETASQRPLPNPPGGFSSHETYNAKASDGATVHYDITIAGAIHGRRAAGSWQATATGPYKDGGSYKCDTGRVTWKALRA